MEGRKGDKKDWGREDRRGKGRRKREEKKSEEKEIR